MGGREGGREEVREGGREGGRHELLARRSCDNTFNFD